MAGASRVRTFGAAATSRSGLSMRTRRSPPRFDRTRIERRVIDGHPADVYEAIRYRSATRTSQPCRSMRPVKRVGAWLLLASAGATVYLRFLRRWHMTCGATEAEAHVEVAGNELMPNAAIVVTRVVESDAPPSAIWKRLVQMGPARGDAYKLRVARLDREGA